MVLFSSSFSCQQGLVSFLSLTWCRHDNFPSQEVDELTSDLIGGVISGVRSKCGSSCSDFSSDHIVDHSLFVSCANDDTWDLRLEVKSHHTTKN